MEKRKRLNDGRPLAVVAPRLDCRTRGEGVRYRITGAGRKALAAAKSLPVQVMPEFAREAVDKGGSVEGVSDANHAATLDAPDEELGVLRSGDAGLDGLKRGAGALGAG